MSTETEIGRVVRVRFEREDHGILTFSVMIDFGGSTQSFGSYTLDGPDKSDPEKRKRRARHVAGAFLMHLVDFFGGDLDKAPRTPVVAHREGGIIRRIARLDCDGGAMLDPKALFAAYPDVTP